MLESRQVFCATAPKAEYSGTLDHRLPEFPSSEVTPALDTLHRLLRDAGLDKTGYGGADWNPLGEFAGPGKKVLIKPNWVRHFNSISDDNDCLIAHGSVIESIIKYVARTGVERVTVGDAPVQGCDFEKLLTIAGNERLIGLTEAGCKVAIEDFRRTILNSPTKGGTAKEDSRPVEDYVLFDLGNESTLEPITNPDVEFRVTMYDPDLLMRRHGVGTHQYLIARPIMDADLVINVPKLKTHKKSGVTGSLKNLVGINGNKEFLPHHRKGGSGRGGDCYPGRSPIKSTVETMYDAINRSRDPLRRRALASAARAVHVTGRILGNDGDYEGSWYGNDTVWRMCLDLQRILHYGRPDGTIADRPQRQVLSITDAIIAGEGDGPLSPKAVPLGLMTYARNTCAAEWVHGLLMGYDPGRVPLIRNAFEDHTYPLVTFGPGDVEAIIDGAPVTQDRVFERAGRLFDPPAGWKGHIESNALQTCAE